MQDIILYTDAKNTTETALFAASLGTKELLIAFQKHDKTNDDAFRELQEGVKDAKLRKALLIKDAREAQKYAQHYDELIGTATRDVAESKQVRYLHGAETLEDKDKTHHRGSGMNHVLAKILAEKKKTYCFDLSLLLGNPDQARVLGRMQQNKRIIRNYGAATQTSSFATTPLRVRAPKERAHFLEML
ncbi:hypothetical protein JXA12_02585 [Candidatus Woesearchaeota archaeon]|nr:hypothetical protein [Candidatus Woesearchaeota archaeon]